VTETSTTQEHSAGTTHTHDPNVKGHHPSDMLYVKVAAVLAVLTAIEVATYFESVFPFFENRALLIPLLLILMAIKFYLIAKYFMHLKFDDKLLERVFLVGLVTAAVVYVVMLSAFRFWEGVPPA
jgi:cytochrome c oxidase subunit IV